MNILILCTGNSCRSQIAHGFLDQLTDNSISVFSAGVEKHGLNKNAVKCMAEIGIDISNYNSNLVDEYINKQFDLFIYPDKNHSIYGENTRLHLFTQITDYIINNL